MQSEKHRTLMMMMMTYQLKFLHIYILYQYIFYLGIFLNFFFYSSSIFVKKMKSTCSVVLVLMLRCVYCNTVHAWSYVWSLVVQSMKIGNHPFFYNMLFCLGKCSQAKPVISRKKGWKRESSRKSLQGRFFPKMKVIWSDDDDEE